MKNLALILKNFNREETPLSPSLSMNGRYWHRGWIPPSSNTMDMRHCYLNPNLCPLGWDFYCTATDVHLVRDSRHGNFNSPNSGLLFKCKMWESRLDGAFSGCISPHVWKEYVIAWYQCCPFGKRVSWFKVIIKSLISWWGLLYSIHVFNTFGLIYLIWDTKVKYSKVSI